MGSDCCSAKDEEKKIKTVAKPIYLPHCNLGQSNDFDSPINIEIVPPTITKMKKINSVKHLYGNPQSCRELLGSEHNRSRKADSLSVPSASVKSSSSSRSRRPEPISQSNCKVMNSKKSLDKAYREGKLHHDMAEEEQKFGGRNHDYKIEVNLSNKRKKNH